MMFNYCTQFPQNWQSSLAVNISRSTAIQHVYCVPRHHRRLATLVSTIYGTDYRLTAKVGLITLPLCFRDKVNTENWISHLSLSTLHSVYTQSTVKRTRPASEPRNVRTSLPDESNLPPTNTFDWWLNVLSCWPEIKACNPVHKQAEPTRGRQ